MGPEVMICPQNSKSENAGMFYDCSINNFSAIHNEPQVEMISYKMLHYLACFFLLMPITVYK